MKPTLPLATLFSALLLRTAHAQTGPTEPRNVILFDLTGAVGPTLNCTAAAGWGLWGLDQAGRVQAGFGLRASYFFAEVNDYDGQNTPAGYTLRVPETRIVALNFAWHLRVRVAGPVRVGFNLDAAGLSFGPERTAQANGTPARLSPDRPGTRPVLLNVLRGGAADRGSLNSELYAAVALPRGLSLRAGYSHIVTGYRTDYFADDAGRYRRFRNLALLGLSYTLPARQQP
jgi:hypothetical protein